MSDTIFLRKMTSQPIKLADVQRQERADEQLAKIERMLHNLLGWLPAKKIGHAAIQRFNTLIMQQAHALFTKTDQEIVGQFYQALEHIKQQGSQIQALALVFACVGEGIKRSMGMWPHPVQFMGAHVLLCGRLAEMRTGEGKTLVAGLTATIMAGSGAAVHVLSTNDYLAQRDCEEMSPLFRFFGLEAAYIESSMEIEPRRAAYAKPICYVSGKEVVFDYLKDRLSGQGVVPNRVMQLQNLLSTFSSRGATANSAIIPALHFCIVDEADSVLIDEARTPMVISQDAASIIEPNILSWAITQARRLLQDVDYKIHVAQHDVELSAVLHTAVDVPPAGVRPIWFSMEWQRIILRQALLALHIYQKDMHYIILNDKIQIVDESTGRVMEDRSWEQGLHQLIETKEGVAITSGRETLARMTFQRFFRRYLLLSGLTGTGLEVSRELWVIYRLKVCQIPPNKPSRRRQLPSQYYTSQAAKNAAISHHAMLVASQGRPVLIGTRSVETSEAIARELSLHKVPHIVLNARQDEQEAEIIAQAGHSGQITVATNMAGRGTDIKLSGPAREAGGLHVILSEYHESARIDRQLFGRSGRQGDPGSCCAIISADDELIKTDGGWYLKLLPWIKIRLLQQFLLALCVRRVQQLAQRRAYHIRMSTFKQDQKLSQQIGFAGKVH